MHSITISKLPYEAKKPVNRCNLPADVLGDISFQNHPKPLCIDGVAQLHKHFFLEIAKESESLERSRLFTQYMSDYFSLDHLEDAGFERNSTVDRSRANYLMVLRGWYFDSDSKEGAIIKGWVESRFGLVPRYHRGIIRNCDDDNYRQFVSHNAQGLYNTNALEAQLDLLYSYCQFELRQRLPRQSHLLLYRGQSGTQSLEQLSLENLELSTNTNADLYLLLNNINSFTTDVDLAGEFGDIVVCVKVPVEKLLFYSGLIANAMKSEKEYAVIGGVYRASLVR